VENIHGFFAAMNEEAFSAASEKAINLSFLYLPSVVNKI
jgi:hypothetical protein